MSCTQLHENWQGCREVQHSSSSPVEKEEVLKDTKSHQKGNNHVYNACSSTFCFHRFYAWFNRGSKRLHNNPQSKCGPYSCYFCNNIKNLDRHKTLFEFVNYNSDMYTPGCHFSSSVSPCGPIETVYRIFDILRWTLIDDLTMFRTRPIHVNCLSIM